MKSSVKVFVALAAAVALSSSAHANTLLDLTDVGAGTPLDYNLVFTATGTSTTLTDAGYQVHGFTNFVDNSVTASGGGANLLQQVWSFTAAPSGSDTSQFNDGTSVNGLSLGATTIGSYDEYSQTFATTIGASYVYSFHVANFSGAPNGFMVSVTGAGGGTGAVPEPAAWAMMLVGFGGLGAVMRRRRLQAALAA